MSENQNKARSGIPHDWQSQPSMVLNRMNRFPTIPSGWLKIPKLVKKFLNEWGIKQKKRFSILSPDEWEPNKARSGIPHDWQSQPSMVLNRMNPFPTGPSGWLKIPKLVKKFLKEWGIKQKKQFSILSPDEGEPNKARSGIPHEW